MQTDNLTKLIPLLEGCEVISIGGARSNELERLYLTAMDFQVNVKASLYARLHPCFHACFERSTVTYRLCRFATHGTCGA
jgi:hypothetical protein